MYRQRKRAKKAQRKRANMYRQRKKANMYRQGKRAKKALHKRANKSIYYTYFFTLTCYLPV